MNTEQNITLGAKVRAGITAIVWVAVSLVLLALTTGLLRQGGVPPHAAMMGASLLGIGGIGWALARAEGYPVAWRSLTGRDLGRGLALGTALALVGSGLVMLAIQYAPDAWAPRIAARQAAYEALLRPHDWRYIPVVLVVVSLTPALTEEFFYRQVVATRLATMGIRVAIVFGALLFGLAHLDVFSFLPLVVVGVVLGVERSARDWVACVLPHVVLNVWGGLITPRLPTQWLEAPGVAWGAVGVGALLLWRLVPWREGWWMSSASAPPVNVRPSTGASVAP